MATPKWFVIGRNQYRLAMSGIREIRPYFPYIMIGLLALYVVYLAPAMVDLFIDEALVFLFSQAAVAMIQIILFVIFVWFFFFPISLALRDIETSQLELFLSAPVKPSHLLLGEFLGVMPFYAIAVTIIVGVFTAILNPLGIGVLQTVIIIMIFILTFFSALWIGTLVAALLRAKLGQSERGRDIGKAIGFVMALPVVGIMYAMMGGGLLETLSDPGTSSAVTSVLGLFPSSWGARIIIDFASNPGNIGTVWVGTLARFGGLALFFVASLWLGVKIADRAYSLETSGLSASKAGPDGVFYNTVRALVGGGSFGTLLVSITKDYGRRLQNLSRVAYIVGLVVLINIFLVRPDDPVSAMIMAQALFAMLAVFVVGEVTVRGKETLFIYRKAPSGNERLIKARLVQGWMISLPIAVVITAAQLSLIPQVTLSTVLIYTGFIAVVVAAYVVFSLGLFLVMPAFSDKGGEFVATSMVVVMFAAGMFIASLIFFGKVWGMLSLLLLSWSFGVLFLLLGKRNLSRIE